MAKRPTRPLIRRHIEGHIRRARKSGKTDRLLQLLELHIGMDIMDAHGLIRSASEIPTWPEKQAIQRAIDSINRRKLDPRR